MPQQAERVSATGLQHGVSLDTSQSNDFVLILKYSVSLYLIVKSKKYFNKYPMIIFNYSHRKPLQSDFGALAPKTKKVVVMKGFMTR